jgi:small subunit ribosomal protein S20
MANIKSARKRARQAIERRDHNMGLRTALRASQQVIDRVVAKGILHRNAGDRHKSRLAQAVKALSK